MASLFIKSNPLRSIAPDAYERAVGANGLLIGALLVAGYFTFLETRLLGHWLFG